MDWGSVFKGDNSVTPYQGQLTPKTHFFGQSVSSKTIRKPDGTVEFHHTVKDSQGNEETTVTHRLGEKEYSYTKRRDKDGKEEIIENMINMDEKDIGKLFSLHKLPDSDPKPGPFFDKFFK